MTRQTGLVCLLMAMPLLAGDTPNFSGKWKLNETQSADANHRGTVFVIEHKEPAFKYSASGLLGTARPFSEAYEFTTDGKTQPASEKPQIVAHWEGSALVMDFVKGSELLARFKFHLSSDGKQMFREADLKDGRKIREIYDRQ